MDVDWIWSDYHAHYLERCGVCDLCREPDLGMPCRKAPGMLRWLDFGHWWAETWSYPLFPDDLPPSGVRPLEPLLMPRQTLDHLPRSGLVTPLRRVLPPREGELGGLAVVPARRGSQAVGYTKDGALLGLGYTGLANHADTVILVDGVWDQWAAELLAQHLDVVVLGAVRRTDLVPIATSLAGRRHGRVVVVPRMDQVGQRVAAEAVARLYASEVPCRMFPTGAWLRAAIPRRIEHREVGLANLSGAWDLWPPFNLGRAQAAFADGLAGRLEREVARAA
jgi:hypothetical protein